MIEQQKEHSKASEEIIIEDLNRIVDALSMHLQNDTSGKISELNLFKALGIDRREIYICRFIGALLENEGYLISFAQRVLKIDKINNLWFCLEDVIKDDRRVDLLIGDGNNRYPVEVKIDARDQDRQIYDYFYFYKNQGNAIEKIFYLTIDGHMPSDKSLHGLDRDKIICVSFDSISKWLNELICCADETNIMTILLTQFKEVVDEMTKEELEKSLIRKVFDGNDDVLMKILKYKDDLVRDYQINFLINSIPPMDSIEVSPADSNDLSDDKRRRVTIRRNEETIAYICVDTNVYLIMADKSIKKSNKSDLWHKNENWQYLYFNKKEVVPLREPANNAKLSLYNNKHFINYIDLINDIR